MHRKPTKVLLLILGAFSLVSSRLVFFFINDPEGPNLLIVVILAAIIYGVALAGYTFLFPYITDARTRN